METVAVYWEPVIKTYGFQKKENLVLIKLTTPKDRRDDLGSCLAVLEKTGVRYVFSLQADSGDKSIERFILVQPFEENYVREVLEQYQGQYAMETEAPVDLVFFQGPHFGDRFGIAEAVFSTLLSKKIPFLLCGCAGASVYLVFPDKLGEKAISVLKDAFQTPE
jgi:aspartokinase